MFNNVKNIDFIHIMESPEIFYTFNINNFLWLAYNAKKGIQQEL